MFAYLKGNPRFLRYWIASWFSELGDNLRNMALTFVILEQQGSHSSIAISLNLFCEYAPICVFGFIIGVYADRWDRKRSVIGALFVRALIMLVIIAAINSHSLIFLYACSFCSAICTVLFRASTGGFTMLFIDREDRALTAGLRQMSMSVLTFVGPAIATYFYSAIGADLTLVSTTALFILSIALLMTIRVPKTSNVSSPGEQALRKIRHDLQDGFRYAKQHRPLRMILGSNLLFGVSAGTVNTMSIFLLTEYLRLPKETYAIIGPVEGVGMLVCSAMFTKWKLRSERLVVLSLLMMGIGLVGLVFPKNVYFAFLSAAILAGGVVGNNIGTSTLFQTRVDFAYQGRANVITQACWMGTMVILMPICGWLHESLSVRPLFLSAGIALLAGACYLQWSVKRKPLEQYADEPLSLHVNP
ncbi:MAG: MFS transporter [Tumebacillaceae bacterium]